MCINEENVESTKATSINEENVERMRSIEKFEI